MPSTPTDPTKAQVWITGTAPNQQFEFYIPRGAKGETGGITFGADLNGLNLNDVKVPGVYRLSSTQNALLLKNYPRDTDTGVLVVHNRTADGATTDQEWITFTGLNGQGGRYIRQLNSGVWSAWRYMATSRVDQTAGRVMYQWDELNQRDQLIYGDTGWRNVLADATWLSAFSSTTMTPNLIRVRRTGYEIHIRVGYSKTASGREFTGAAIPTGFNLNGAVLDASYVGSDSVPTFTRFSVRSGATSIIDGAATNNANVYMVYNTNDSWPTTLPGTAVNTIPSI